MSCVAFSCLFLGSNDFKLNVPDKKIIYFEEIINFLKTRKVSNIFYDLQQPYDLLMLYKNLFKEDFYANIALVIFNFETNSIIEFTIKLIQKYYNVIIDFDLNQLKSLSASTSIVDLYKIFVDINGNGQNENLIYLKIENEHIVYLLFTNKEIIEDINSVCSSKINEKIKINKNTQKNKKKKKKKKKNKTKSNNIIEEDEKVIENNQ